jgi:hypothetical protein
MLLITAILTAIVYIVAYYYMIRLGWWIIKKLFRAGVYIWHRFHKMRA